MDNGLQIIYICDGNLNIIMIMNRLQKIAAVLVAGMSMSISATTAEAQTKTGIVAHRGFWNCEEAGYAKNSVAALRCAQEAGFWGSEFDVNMTSDGVLLVYHDGKVEGGSIENNPYSAFKDFRASPYSISEEARLRRKSRLPASTASTITITVSRCIASG